MCLLTVAFITNFIYGYFIQHQKLALKVKSHPGANVSQSYNSNRVRRIWSEIGPLSKESYMHQMPKVCGLPNANVSKTSNSQFTP